MTVFMPLATPVWWLETALHDEVAERGEREADTDAEQAGGDQQLGTDGDAQPRAARRTQW